MIHADGNQHSQFGILHNIGGIQIAAHSGLQKDQITIFFPKIQKRCRGLNLKRGGMIHANRCHLIN